MGLLLRLIIAAGLAVAAYVHFDEAAGLGDTSDAAISKALMFQIHAVVGILAGVLVLIRPRRWTYGLAFLVAAAAVGAAVLYRYVDVGEIGPIENMYEPIWYKAKNIATIAEAISALAALAGFVLDPHAPMKFRQKHSAA